MKSIGAVLAAALLLGACSTGGPYVAGSLGASFPANDVDIGYLGRAGAFPEPPGTAQLDPGILATVAFGRSFARARVEGELVYNTNDISTVSVPGVGDLSASGDVSTLALMVNGYYDFSTNSKWKPYIGGGIGGGNVSVNSLSVQGMPAADDDGTVFAYQFKVGVAYEFTQALDATLGYRYFGALDIDEGTYVSSYYDLGNYNFQVHVIELGVRYRF